MNFTKTTKVTRITKRETKPDGSIVETVETTTVGMTPEEAEAEFKKMGIEPPSEEVFAEVEKTMDSVNEAMEGVRSIFSRINLFGVSSKKTKK